MIDNLYGEKSGTDCILGWIISFILFSRMFFAGQSKSWLFESRRAKAKNTVACLQPRLICLSHVLFLLLKSPVRSVLCHVRYVHS